jgi:hypothetical protein
MTKKKGKDVSIKKNYFSVVWDIFLLIGFYIFLLQEINKIIISYTSKLRIKF